MFKFFRTAKATACTSQLYCRRSMADARHMPSGISSRAAALVRIGTGGDLSIGGSGSRFWDQMFDLRQIQIVRISRKYIASRSWLGRCRGLLALEKVRANKDL
jgi:hypothetical protein